MTGDRHNETLAIRRPLCCGFLIVVKNSWFNGTQLARDILVVAVDAHSLSKNI